MVDVVAVVAPHVVREDVGWNEGVCGGGVGHEVGTTSDGNTAVERGLRIGVEHLGNTQCNGLIRTMPPVFLQYILSCKHLEDR